MANVVLPRVHVMVLCDEIEPSSVEEDVFDLHGVRTHITARSFPYTHPQLTVYLQMTGHDGTATGWAVVADPATDTEISVTQEEEITFHGPLSFVTVRWQILDCSFPEPGLYYVQAYFGGKQIGERALFLEHGQAVTTNGRQTG